jgi:hypothetical protein
LVGDSPELIAFALLRSLAQIEQKQPNFTIDRRWLLDAYAECLRAVKGHTDNTSAGSQPRRPRSAQQ